MKKIFKKPVPERLQEETDPHETDLAKSIIMPTDEMKHRAMVIAGLVLLLIVPYLLYKLADVQIIHREEYLEGAVTVQYSVQNLSYTRGTIYDTNGNTVAVSETCDNLIFAPAVIAEEMAKKDYTYDLILEYKSYICQGIARILELDPDDLMEDMSRITSRYCLVARNLTTEQSEKISSFVTAGYWTDDKKGKYRLFPIVGVTLEKTQKRVYPYESFAASVIGCMGDDSGRTGVEAAYDETLSGQNGRVISQRTKWGTTLAYLYRSEQSEQNGASLRLTIDHTVQSALEETLRTAVLENSANYAAGIVMNVKTGAICGMGQWPSYDLNDPDELSDYTIAKVTADMEATGDSEQEDGQGDTLEETLEKLSSEQILTNALFTEYEPGSTFKIITAAMALEENLVSDSSEFLCEGHSVYSHRLISCWKSEGHGLLSFREAIMNSCNCAFMSIGDLIGSDRFAQYMRSFGLVEKTGIDLPGETIGTFYTDEAFRQSASSLAVASFGQRFTVTPMQMITVISGIVNGGKMMQPYVVDAVLDSEGNTIEETEPIVSRVITSQYTSDTLCDILEDVVSSGTGRNAYVSGYRIGGKTGTSEKNSANAEEQVYTASFIGIAPMDDPSYAVLILIDEPSGEHYQGGQIAAPLAGELMAKILPYLGVEASYGEGELTEDQKEVPSLLRISTKEAEKTLTDEGLTYRIVGEGNTVTAQEPASGSVISQETPVILYCGTEPENTMVEMPSLIGMSYQEAVETLWELGLYCTADGALASGDRENCLVRSQSIAKGERVRKGSVITLIFIDNNTYNTGE